MRSITILLLYVIFISCGGVSNISNDISKEKNEIEADIVKKNSPFIKEEIIDDFNERYTSDNVSSFNIFYYRIQILALENEIYTDNLRLFLKFIEKDIYFNDDTGLTSYLVGKFTKYSDAFFLKEYMLVNGIPDAFIVGFIDDKRVSIDQIIELEKK